MNLRRLLCRCLAALGGLVACAAQQPTVEVRYLTDADFRRAALDSSLVNRNNGYSKARIAHYASGRPGDWDTLPQWNPAAEPLRVGLFRGAAEPLSEGAAPLEIDARASAGEPEALRALGERAFFRYPVQVVANTPAITSEAAAASYGLWSDEARGIGGLVRFRSADGLTHLAYSCASCHAGMRDGKLTIGVSNDLFDVGRLLFDSNGRDPSAAALLAWGPGRLDVTTPEGTEPVRIADLRPVRGLTYLHHTASVAQRDQTSLAVRIETLIIVSSGQTLRPPRAVALGLAIYIRSLADGLVPRPATTQAELRGEALFSTRCATCHAAPAYTGPAVPIELVGTDPVVGRSADRATGNYRVPSLLGVGSRGRLLHDASSASLTELFDPLRVEAGYRGRLGGPIVGHRFGLDLAPAERAAIVAFLSTL